MAEMECDTEMHIDNEENDLESIKVNGDMNGSADPMETSECASPISVTKNSEQNCGDDESNSHDNQNNETTTEFNASENSNKSFDDKDDNKSCDDNDEIDENQCQSRPDSAVSENLSRNHNTDSQASNHSVSSVGSSQQEFSNGKNKENSNDTQSSVSAKQEDGILIPSDSEDEVEALDEESDEEDEDMVSNGVSMDEPMSIHSDTEEESISEKTGAIECDTKQKVNGKKDSTDVHEIESDKDDCVINLDTPEKEIKEKPAEPTPRRSSRNITRKKYSEDFEQDLDFHKDEESDLEEVVVADPLADSLSNRSGSKQKSKLSAPIVVKDTKRLVEITTKNMTSNNNANNKSGKKSPTLVIIDTNSILSGRGPVPMGNAKQGYSVLPVAVPAQGLYPPNIRGATITPVNNTTIQKVIPAAVPAAPSLVLPNLTDDMFVVEAPSFIVPYVYEKPPSEPFRQFVDKMGKEVEEARKLAEEQEKAEEEKEGREKRNDKENGEENNDKDNKESDGKKKSKKSRRKKGDDDESWDENDTSDTEDDDDVVGKKIQKEVLVKDIKEDSLEAIKKHIITPDSVTNVKPADKKSDSYFENPIGKFFMNIGINLVQEYVQTDLLKQQKRKRDRENKTSTNSTATQMAINSLIKNLEFSKENNEPYHFEQKRCEMCNFKTESALALAHHMETPHMRNYFYRCNFCPFEIRSPHDILIHMEVEHKTKGRLERAASYHQCPNCPFEDNGKAKLARHQLACAKKFKPEINLGPPMDWEPPAKIPRTSRPKQSLTSAASAYQQAMANQARVQPAAVPKLVTGGGRGRGRPALNKTLPVSTGQPLIRGNMMYRTNMQSGNQLLLPNSYPYNTSQLMQVVGTSVNMLPGTMVATSSGSVTIQTTPSGSSKTTNNSKILHQPSISITPLPRQSASSSNNSNSQTTNAKPGQQTAGKAAFVICEICDGYIKDLDQLRNHMQWIHKVKIHPKMIYNRPPLNCQKCQFRFFTDQGLERHLLGSHGLVTSSMQEAANKGKDAGRCPVCGRVYQWKLLNHVNRDHNMTLKPAHLSYKCTVCTATFGMYKQFENHVYSAHSVVAKKVMDKKATPSSSSSNNSLNKSGDSLLKPLKINDEITIIPQPPKPRPGPASRTSGNNSATLTVTKK